LGEAAWLFQDSDQASGEMPALNTTDQLDVSLWKPLLFIVEIIVAIPAGIILWAIVLL
jgi:hypothetical protein